jgi:hypothetical protein
VFDNSNGRVNISSSKVYEMMARYIYLMVCGELTQDYNSIDNNLNPKIRGVNRMLNKPTCYSSFGYYSVVFPKSVAVQLASADLALDVVEQELVTAAAERISTKPPTPPDGNKIHFSNQSPQILQSLRSTTTPRGTGSISRTPSARRWPTSISERAAGEPRSHPREYDTRFSTTDLALRSRLPARGGEAFAISARTWAEIQKLADPPRTGASVRCTSSSRPSTARSRDVRRSRPSPSRRKNSSPVSRARSRTSS